MASVKRRQQAKKTTSLYTNEKAIAKYWSYVNVTDVDDCWEWIGQKGGKMSFTASDGRQTFLSTKKMMYSQVMDNVPTGRIPSLVNLCGNPNCLNPTHYELKVNLPARIHPSKVVQTSNGPRALGMSNVQTAWEQVRSLLLEVANIIQPLSDEEANEVADLMEEWMNENPI